MPHLIIEYAREVEKQHDIDAAIASLFEAALTTGEMERADTKVRAMAFDHHMMPEDGETFVHLTVRLLTGRTAETKQKIGALLLENLTNSFPTVTSVSVDFLDLDRAVYSKRVL